MNRSRKLFRALLGGLLALGFYLSCYAAAQEGKNGALTVTAANTVLNQYAVLGANVSAGATSFSVTNIADLSSSFGALAAGDLVMLYQAQGATIDTTDTASYGAVTNLNSAGRYEVVTVGSVSGNTITVDASCVSLKYSYATSGNAQVIRIPQFTTLTVNSGASVVPTAWNGQKGGVVAVHAQTAVINGTVGASGLGFRGGALDNASQAAGTDVSLYRSATDADGAEKGESIAGYQATYTNGRYGRGAPANGGGGGNSHNAGGGGGANGNNGATWSGQGIKDPDALYATAWARDPGNGSMTTGSGGGRGGYTFSNSNQDALTLGPGGTAWGGNLRRERGGLGGRPLDNDAAGRIFLGGGGGAGDANNSAGGAGGAGGGFVLVIANTVSGSGTFSSNGAAGQNSRPGESNIYNDAPGGGGGGGSVVVRAITLSGVSVQANGGAGGTQPITSAEAEGPGGGGGGGFIATSGGTVTQTAAGGVNGTTTSTALTEFPPNGATRGATGQTGASAASAPVCTVPVGTVSGTVFSDTNRSGTQNAGENAFTAATVTVTLTNTATNQTYTATTTTGSYTLSTPAGSYTVTATAPGYSVTTPARTVTVTANTAATVPVIGLAVQQFDFGDAPSAYGAASHTILAGSLPRLGVTAPDADTGSGFNGTVSSTAADEDDTNDGAVAAGGPADDEDALGTLPALTTADASYTLTVPLQTAVGQNATLAAWIDFNRDTIFAPNEGLTVPVSAGATSAVLSFNSASTPGFSGRSPGRTYVRLRIGNGATLTTATPTGAEASGEVEDYPLLILDAPQLCEGQPIALLNFANPTLISGTALSVGAEYRFSDVAPGLDAIVRIDATGGTGAVNVIDDPSAGDSKGFQPTLAGNGAGNVDFTITFVVGGSRTPYPLSRIYAHGLDIDGDGTGKREYSDFGGYSSYRLDNPTNLTYSANPTAGFNGRFESATTLTQPGISTAATENIVRAVYEDVSSLRYRIGALGTNNSTRQTSLLFQCVEFKSSRDVSLDKKQRAGTSGAFQDADISVLQGNLVQYQLTVTNNGPNAANGATFSDTLPANLTNPSVVSITASSGVAGQSASFSGNTLTGTVATTFPANGSVTIVVQATASASGTVVNTAAVSPPPNTTDLNTANNMDSVTTLVTPQANLGVVKTKLTPSGDPVQGQPVSYQLVVTNSGPSNVTGLSVTDNVPVAVTGVTWTCAAAGTGDCDTTLPGTGASGSGNSVSLTNAQLNAGAGNTLTLTVSGTVSQTATGPLVNTAAVAPPSGTTDPVLGNNSSTVSSPVQTAPDLTLSKSHSAPFTVGQPGTYSFTVTNGGGSSSVGPITVEDTLPAGLTVNGGGSGAVTSGNAAWACSSNAATPQTVTCTSNTAITALGSSTFSFDVNVGVATAPGTNSITNTASVSGGGDSNPVNNGAADPTTVLSPDLSITKTATSSPFVQGGKANYKIRVYNDTTNTSTAPTSGTITVTDTLPTGLSVPAGAVTLTAGGSVWSCSASGQVITCTYTKSLSVRSGSTFNFVVNVASPAPANVTNKVTVTGENEATANVGDSNTNSVTTPTVDAGRLTLVKSVRNVTKNSAFGSAGSGEPGDVLEYCIAYRNPGQSPVSVATIRDTVPTFTVIQTNVLGYGGAAIRWRVTLPSASTQNLSADADSDAGEISGNILTTRLDTVPAGGAGDVCFQASIE